MSMMFVVAVSWDFMQLFLCTRDAGPVQSWRRIGSGAGDPGATLDPEKLSH